MTKKFVVYCAVNFTRQSGRPVSLALVLPDGRWLYAEVLDFDLAECDARTLEVLLPLMRRIPGTRFVKGDDLKALVIDSLRLWAPPGEEIEVRYAATARSARNLLGEMLQDFSPLMGIKGVALEGDRLLDFQRHCGGSEKTDGHALMDAIGAALCDLHREVPTSFHEAPIVHLELLLGSKSAMSFRAWARAQERERDALAHAQG